MRFGGAPVQDGTSKGVAFSFIHQDRLEDKRLVYRKKIRLANRKVLLATSQIHCPLRINSLDNS
jgi:hypothetical protein